jgi:hypothetical protein
MRILIPEHASITLNILPIISNAHPRLIKQPFIQKPLAPDKLKKLNSAADHNK